jgi:hypothetical protein
MGACALSTEVNVRPGTVAGKAGPLVFVEVGRPDTGARFIVPVPRLPANRHPPGRNESLQTGGLWLAV